MPKRITAGIPAETASRTAFKSSSTEYWKCPGIDLIGRFSPLPDRTKSGRTKSAGSTRVSRTRRRRGAVERRRRRRFVGKDIGLFYYNRPSEEPGLRGARDA